MHCTSSVTSGLLVLAFLCSDAFARRWQIRSSNITSSVNATSSNDTSDSSFWLDEVKHQGVAPFSGDASYKVYRNVKDYGAIGDGIADDTAAINLAISDGNRCKPGVCLESTTKPATIYIPAGTYLISAPLVDYYFTQIIGNPNTLPTIQATSNFTGFAMIEANLYQPGGLLAYNATRVFYRQVRNLILDTTMVPANKSINGIHWPTAQATSLEKIIFNMSQETGTQHIGLFVEGGSGGLMNDMVFYGGAIGASLGNQQFTSRNMWFNNAGQAIQQTYDWGWTYKGIHINNCSIGLNMSNPGATAQTVGSMTMLDSSITDTPVGILTARYDNQDASVSNGSIILENVDFHNVEVAVQGSKNWTALPGASGDFHVAGWGIGHQYTSNGPSSPSTFLGTLHGIDRATSLTYKTNTTYFERSKPNYNSLPASKFISVRTSGAVGDGVTDDTAALQSVLDYAGSLKEEVAFFDAGIYKVTKTIVIPKNCRIVGESYPLILSSGDFFADMNNPRPVVQVASAGDSGIVEWSDMVVGTQGAQAGAILIQWNLASAADSPSGMWDVHTRIGGFAGSKLGLAECPASPGNTTTTGTSTKLNSSSLYSSAISSSTSSADSALVTSTGLPRRKRSPFFRRNDTISTTTSHGKYHNTTNIKTSCIGAFMSMHITKPASGLYMENVWLWTADHDMDSVYTNITVYSGRGLLVDSEKGDIWMLGTSVEHHALYQYQLANTQNIMMGQMQTETAYYQPDPDISQPFPPVSRLQDPHGSANCQGSNKTGTCDGWGLRVIESQQIAIYGAGLYSFFDDYNNSCSFDVNTNCQSSIFSIEGNTTLTAYNLNTVGAISMVDKDGQSWVQAKDNPDVFPDTVAYFTIS